MKHKILLIINNNYYACFHEIKIFPCVARSVVNHDGCLLGAVVKYFNGSRKDAICRAKEITPYMFEIFPSASNIQSIIRAYTKNRKFRLKISQNFKIIHEISNEIESVNC